MDVTRLLAYYKMNQGLVNANNSTVNTLTDLSGNNKTGTLSGFALSGTTSNWVAGTVTGNAPTIAAPTVTASNNGPVNNGSTINLSAVGTGTFSWTGPNGFTSTSQNPIIINATAVNAGTYSVTLTQNGCTATTTTAVVVISTPATALNFDGQNDFVTIPHAADLNAANLTVDTWVKTTNQSASNGSTNFSRGIVNKYFASSGNGYNLYIDGGKVNAWYFGASSYIFDSDYLTFRSTSNIADGNWHRVTFTVDNTGGKIYIDGVLESTRAWSGTPSAATTTQALSIGNYPTNGIPLNQCVFDGSIDEVRIYNRALCLGEIQNNTRELALPQTGLLAYYKMNQGFVAGNNTTVTTLTDLSGNSRTGNLSGFALSGATSNWTTGIVTGTSASFIPPVATITANGPLTFCPTGSVILSANAGTGLSYQWTKNGINIPSATLVNYTASSTGSYNVVVTQNGCTALATAVNITVEDVVKPTITSTQLNIITPLNANNGTATLQDYKSFVTATDDCTNASSIIITQSPAIGTALTQNVPLTVTLKVTDGSGNFATQTFTVTATDQTAPVVLTKNITVSLNSTGNAIITTQQVNNGTTDNSGTFTLSLDKAVFDCTNIGINLVTLTATDASGNTSTATAVVTVEDKIAPIVLVQNKTIQLSALGTASIRPADINNGSTDNCVIATIALSKTAFDCTNVGANTVTLTVTDVNGNVSTATAVVTVEDKIAPIVLTQNITIQLNSNGNAFITPSDVNNNSTDNCGIASYTLSKTSFDCLNVGRNTVTLTVTDVNGNIATATAFVTVVGETTTSSITSVPTSTVFTGGIATNLFLGYGAQSTTLQVSNLVGGGNGTDPRSYTYQWTGTGLSSTTSGSPVFTPTAAGFYSFTVIVTNKYGCKSTASISICVKDIREKDKTGKFTGKVFICHAPSGNVGNSNTLSISVNAVHSHLSQQSFDRLGTCADAPCTSSTGTLVSNSVGGNSTENKVSFIDLNVNSTEFIAYPNPFEKQTTVRFTLPYQEDKATLDIYDLKGVKIQTLFNGNVNAQTTYEVQFNGQNLSAGTYFFRWITSKEVKNFKVIMKD